jgi:hypothetical protein
MGSDGIVLYALGYGIGGVCGMLLLMAGWVALLRFVQRLTGGPVALQSPYDRGASQT